MDVTDHLDLEKVSQREIAKLLRISKLQGQWTSAKSLKHQAEALTGVPDYMMRQFDVHIERVEADLQALGADKRDYVEPAPKGEDNHGIR